MRSSATRGTGQLTLNEVVLTSAIVIVGRARALRRYHRSAERIFRRTLYRKRRALVRLLDALQNESADTLGRLARGLAGKWETEVGVVFLEAPAQLKTAGGNLAQAAPLPRSDFKNLADAILRGAIPFPPHRAAVLVLDSVAAFFQLAHCYKNAFENVEGLESGDHDRHFIFRSDREIFFETHDGTHMAGREKSLHHEIGRASCRE